MSDLTKKAIIDAFVGLISQKPLSKITVKELVEACGITRRTFYYHYQDIYDLVEKIFEQEAERAVLEVRERDLTPENLEEVMIRSARFVIENKQAVFHIYNSVRRENLERYLKKITATIFGLLLKRLGEGINAREEDYRLITAFYTNGFTGMIQDWIEGGMKENPEILIRRGVYLIEGHLEISLQRSAEGNK